MEVHHHPHVPHQEKKWKQYFLEFLMIFLAVTMGFFAEGLRERISENKQEKEIMRTMTKDLAADIIAINETLKEEKEYIKTSDSLIMILGKTNLDQQDMKKVYRLSRFNMSYDAVTFNKIAISELKSNGGAKFIRNKKILKLITNYDLRSDEVVMQGKAVSDFSMKIIDQSNSFFDYRNFSKTGTIESGMNREKYAGNYHFLRNDPLQIRQFSNLIFMKGAIIASYNRMLENQKKEAIKLLKEIKLDYNINDRE
ncbi:hypothetical protein [Halpernia sp.]|uniref:hypothetical protein n=1 Tax=Halpernia sp. TaxID=2782209 RepID=UPI003A8FB130